MPLDRRRLWVAWVLLAASAALNVALGTKLAARRAKPTPAPAMAPVMRSGHAEAMAGGPRRGGLLLDLNRPLALGGERPASDPHVDAGAGDDATCVLPQLCVRGFSIEAALATQHERDASQVGGQGHHYTADLDEVRDREWPQAHRQPRSARRDADDERQLDQEIDPVVQADRGRMQLMVANRVELDHRLGRYHPAPQRQQDEVGHAEEVGRRHAASIRHRQLGVKSPGHRAVAIAVKNDRVAARFTGLAERLQD